LAANIANADTPKFRARDVDFKQMLGNVQREQLQSTHASHFQFADAASSADAVKYRIPFNASVDGNTVEMNIEQAAYGKAAADYQATLSFIQDTGSSIKRALRGE
jgi:flagellar basal-body rod protein FlgB